MEFKVGDRVSFDKFGLKGCIRNVYGRYNDKTCEIKCDYAGILHIASSELRLIDERCEYTGINLSELESR